MAVNLNVDKWVKVLSSNPSSNPGTHMLEDDSWLTQTVLWPPCTYYDMQVYAYTHKLV